MRNLLAAFAVVTAFGALEIAPALAQERTVKDGLLDEIKLLVEKPPSPARVVIRPFSALDSDLVIGDKDKDETKTMQADAPRILAEKFVSRLKELGPYTDVSVLAAGATVPADALLVEGKFTELDPGSRAKRYFVGFGAGKSGVSVEGTVTSSGKVIASFQQRRIGVMGAAGGDSLGKLASDARTIGEDLANFLNAWASGKKLK